jgi:hypothetical protein
MEAAMEMYKDGVVEGLTIAVYAINKHIRENGRHCRHWYKAKEGATLDDCMFLNRHIMDARCRINELREIRNTLINKNRKAYMEEEPVIITG